MNNKPRTKTTKCFSSVFLKAFLILTLISFLYPNSKKYAFAACPCPITPAINFNNYLNVPIGIQLSDNLGQFIIPAVGQTPGNLKIPTPPPAVQPTPPLPPSPTSVSFSGIDCSNTVVYNMYLIVSNLDDVCFGGIPIPAYKISATLNINSGSCTGFTITAIDSAASNDEVKTLANKMVTFTPSTVGDPKASSIDIKANCGNN